MHEIVPRADAFAALINPKNPSAAISAKEVQEAAHALGKSIYIVHASTESELEPAFATIAQSRAGGLLIAPDGLFIAYASLSPPGTEYLTCLVFLTFLLCKFFRQFRDFAPIEQRQLSRRDEFVRYLPRSARARLVCAFWWYGSLCPGNQVRAGRARRVLVAVILRFTRSESRQK